MRAATSAHKQKLMWFGILARIAKRVIVHANHCRAASHALAEKLRGTFMRIISPLMTSVDSNQPRPGGVENAKAPQTRAYRVPHIRGR
jgi:hypothetical protein